MRHIKLFAMTIGIFATLAATGVFLTYWSNKVDRYVCTKGDDGPAFSVTVMSGITLPTRIFVHAKEYRVLTFTGALYNAVEAAPQTADAVGDIEFDTVTGSLKQTNRVPSAVVTIVQDVCNKAITAEQCKVRMNAERGGNIFACFTTETDCARARNLSNVLAIHFYKCQETR